MIIKKHQVFKCILENNFLTNECYHKDYSYTYILKCLSMVAESSFLCTFVENLKSVAFIFFSNNNFLNGKTLIPGKYRQSF